MNGIKNTIVALSVLVIAISTNVNGQVNMQTGSPQINIPLYNISDANNRLGTSVSLNYVGGNGIHVDDIGSSVGTGWEINSSAVTREVIGLPDDQKQRNPFVDPYSVQPSYFVSNNVAYYDQTTVDRFNTYINNYYPNGYLYSEYSPADVINNTGAYLLTSPPGLKQSPPKYLADREMDIYAFDMNGRTGKFMIGKDRSIFFLNEKDNKLKITPTFDESLINQNIRTTLSGFTVTDETGIQYVYSDMELNEVINYTQSNQYNTMDGTFVSADNPMRTGFSYPPLRFEVPSNNPPNLANPCTVSSTGTGFQIVTTGSPTNQTTGTAFRVLKGVKTGQFICNKWALTRIINPLTNKSIEFTYLTENITTEMGHSVTQSTTGTTCGISITVPLASNNVKKIAAITNQYGDKIEFVYGASRQDLPGDVVLQKINFYKNNSFLSDELFAFGYFYQNSVSDFSTNFTAQQLPYTRLSLTKVQKEGLNGTLEPPYVFQYYTSSGTVTGNGSASPADIVPPRSTILHDDQGYFCTPGVPPIIPLNSSNQLFAPSAGNVYPFSVYQAIDYNLVYNSNNSIAKNGMIKTMTLPTSGTVTYNYEPNILLPSSYQTNGVRVLSVVSNDVTTNTATETDYSYVLSDGTTSSCWAVAGYDPPVYGLKKSTSRIRLPGNPNVSINSTNSNSSNLDVGQAFAQKVIFQALPQTQIVLTIINLLEALIQGSHPNPQTLDYEASSTTNHPLNYNNTIPWEYSQVGVTDGNGKTIYYFTSPTDYPLESPGSSTVFSMKQRYGYWKYGLLKKVETYSNSSVSPIKTVQNTYSPNTTNYNSTVNYLSQHWIPNSQYLTGDIKEFELDNTANYSDVNPPTSTDRIISEQYYPFSGKIDLLSTTETTFDASGNNGVSQTTTYQYNADGLPSITSQTDSKGQKFETLTTYPNDYTANGAIGTMQQANNIASPILSETYVYTSPTSKSLLSGSIIGYGQVPNNDIKPITTYGFRSPTTNNALVDNTSLQGFNPAQVVRDPVYYQPTTNLFYDNNGSLIQKTTESGLAKYVYDQPVSDRLIAQATNVSSNRFVAYSSFEDNAHGNWTYSGYSTIVTSPNVPTGQYVYSLSQPNGNITIPSGLDPSTTYIVSYWSNSGSYNVTGSNNIIQGRTSNGWTYYQHTVSNVSSITVSGGNYIDELRLYPKGALMNTYTYNSPLFGISSQCDANNKIVYYTYDDLGRKSTIRDQDQNIIKAFDYKFQQPTPPSFTVSLVNNSTYGTYITTVIIDGTMYSFPVQGGSVTLPITLVPGNHTFQLASGPSNYYTINGTNYTAAQTNPAISLPINGNLTIAYVNGPTMSTSCNLTSDAAHTSACSCHGCQYTSGVYYMGPTLGQGTQLYSDAALTQKITGKTWFYPYTGNIVWPLDSNGVISGPAENCP